jgi:NADH-ubiquinone oxidoreductase chain 2
MLIISLFILLLSNGLTLRKDTSIYNSRLTICILVGCMTLTYNTLYFSYLDEGVSVFNGLFVITVSTQIFHIFVYFITSIMLVLTSFYPRKIAGIIKNSKLSFSVVSNKMADTFTIIEYPAIILFIILGVNLLICCNNLISLFLCIELQSYGLYIICVVHRDSESATSSGLVYFLLGGLSSCFILLGIAFIYINTGMYSLDNIYVMVNLTSNGEFSSDLYNNEFIVYSLLIICIGFLFKVGGAPFHF